MWLVSFMETNSYHSGLAVEQEWNRNTLWLTNDLSYGLVINEEMASKFP